VLRIDNYPDPAKLCGSVPAPDPDSQHWNKVWEKSRAGCENLKNQNIPFLISLIDQIWTRNILYIVHCVQ
jgi:hypothetical protein